MQMLTIERLQQYQQAILKLWVDFCMQTSQEWVRALPILMSNQAYELHQEQRSMPEQIAAQYSEILQRVLTLHLQNFSLYSEISASWMDFLNKTSGIKS
jgi:hypothetical protein